jgi:hypothetical protein
MTNPPPLQTNCQNLPLTSNNSKQLSHSWEADSRAATQNISLLLRTEQTAIKLRPEQIYTSPPSDDPFRAEQIYTRFR